jgi:hypothetical protein
MAQARGGCVDDAVLLRVYDEDSVIGMVENRLVKLSGIIRRRLGRTGVVVIIGPVGVSALMR